MNPEEIKTIPTDEFLLKKGDSVIPCVLWNGGKDDLIIAVHGLYSHKTDVLIDVLADVSKKYGYSVLSFDLPKHGERADQSYELYDMKHCKNDLTLVLKKARTLAKNVSFFGESLGAYLGLTVYNNIQFDKTILVSPLTSMKGFIENVMVENGISQAELKEKKEIALHSCTLYYNFYKDVVKVGEPRLFNYGYVLSGIYNELTPIEKMNEFARNNRATLTLIEAKHRIYQKREIAAYVKWLTGVLERPC